MASLKSFWGIFGMGAMKKNCDYNATGIDHCFVGIPPVSHNKKLSEFRSELEFGTKKYRNFVTNHSEAENFSAKFVTISPKLKIFFEICYESFQS